MSALSLLAVVDSFGNNVEPAADPAATAAGLVVGLIVFVGLYLLSSFLLYRIFEKAGRPGWAGFVPFYNMWVLFEVSGKPGWWALLIIPSLIPFIGLLFSIAFVVMSLIAMLELAKRFGKGPVFGVVALWLFSLVGFIILAFDGSKYQSGGASSAPQAPTNPSAANPQSPAVS